MAVTLRSPYGRSDEAIFDASGNLDISTIPTGGYAIIGGVRLYTFTTAITENSTTTAAPAGSYAFTSNATGKNKMFYSDGSKWQAASNAVTGVLYAETSISSAAITGTAAGQLGHANGVVLVAGQGASTAIEHLSSVVILQFGVAAYTAGGNVSVNYAAGGGAVSGVVSAANSIGAAGDKVAVVLAAVPTNNQLLSNTGLNLVAASAFTNPGTATGVVRVKTAYRVHATGL